MTPDTQLLPSRPPVDADHDEEVVTLEDADAVFDALGSDTRRRIFLSLLDEPQAVSDLAETLDTSLQNVTYHLEELADADLVGVVDTWYSSRGAEMNVYAATTLPVVVIGDDPPAGSPASPAE